MRWRGSSIAVASRFTVPMRLISKVSITNPFIRLIECAHDMRCNLPDVQRHLEFVVSGAVSHGKVAGIMPLIERFAT